MEKDTTMLIQITARHMVGGQGHEHIAAVRWREMGGQQGIGDEPRAEVVYWLERDAANRAIAGIYPTNYAEVGVVHPAYGDPYLRTHADGRWTDNLLALPTY